MILHTFANRGNTGQNMAESIENTTVSTTKAHGWNRDKGRCVEMQKEFGIVLKKLREETGLSQEKFALSIGMDRTYYASVEAGKRNISLQNICKIAEGFGMSVSALFVVVEKQ